MHFHNVQGWLYTHTQVNINQPSLNGSSFLAYSKPRHILRRLSINIKFKVNNWCWEVWVGYTESQLKYICGFIILNCPSKNSGRFCWRLSACLQLSIFGRGRRLCLSGDQVSDPLWTHHHHYHHHHHRRHHQIQRWYNFFFYIIKMNYYIGRILWWSIQSVNEWSVI